MELLRSTASNDSDGMATGTLRPAERESVGGVMLSLAAQHRQSRMPKWCDPGRGHGTQIKVYPLRVSGLIATPGLGHTALGNSSPTLLALFPLPLLCRDHDDG